METTRKNSSEEEMALLKLCEKRQQLYTLLQRSMDENSRQYDDQMSKLHQEIDQLMAGIGE